MRLAIVPQIETPDASLGGALVRRPDLPAEILARRGAWGQASSALEARGRVVVWLDVTDSEAAALAKRPGCDVRGRAHPLRETRAMRAGMDAGAASARREWVDAYRMQAAAIEDAERRRVQLVALGRLVALFGAVVVTELVLRHVIALPPGVSLAAVLATDNCNGTDGASFHGRSTTTGGATWSTFIGADWLQVQSNRAYSTNVGIGWLSSISDIADVYVQGVAKTSDFGPYARVQTSGNTSGYWLRHSGTNVDMYRAYPGATYVQLGSNGSAPGTDPTLRIECSGTSISGYLNGVLDVGPVTDSTWSTGKVGVFILQSAKYGDDWEYGDLASGAVTRASLLTLLGVS